jgi:hypothetical protein
MGEEKAMNFVEIYKPNQILNQRMKNGQFIDMKWPFEFNDWRSCES